MQLFPLLHLLQSSCLESYLAGQCRNVVSVINECLCIGLPSVYCHVARVLPQSAGLEQLAEEHPPCVSWSLHIYKDALMADTSGAAVFAQRGVGQDKKNAELAEVGPAAMPPSSDCERVLELTGGFGCWMGCEAPGSADVSPAVLSAPLPAGLSPETSRRCPLNG